MVETEDAHPAATSSAVNTLSTLWSQGIDLHDRGAAEDPSSAQARRSWRWWAFAFALTVPATVGQLYRSNVRPWHAWWAEDGALFYPDALRYSFARTLTLIYNGYLQTVSRPVAALAAVFPPADAPAAMAAGTDAVIAVLAVYVWSASRSTLKSRWGPVLIGALMVVIPQAGFETVSSVADLHWYFDFACLWAVWRPLSARWSTMSSTMVVLLAVLSDPLAALMLLPGLIALVSSPRDRRRRSIVLGALVLGALVQVVVQRFSTPFRAPLRAFDILRFFVVRVVEAMVIGESWVSGIYNSTGLALGVVVTLTLGLVVAVALRRLGVTASIGPLTCIVLAAAYTLICLRYRGDVTVPARRYSYDGSRYTLVPALLLWSSAVMIVERLVARSQQGRARRRHVGEGAVAVFLLAALGTTVANWDTLNVRDFAPAWPAQVARARLLCRLPPAARPRPLDVLIRDNNAPRPQAGRGDVTFPVAPDTGQSARFVLVLPCSSLGT